MVDNNSVSLCNGTNHDNYIEIGIKGIDIDIVYVSMFKWDCTQLINSLTYLCNSSVYPDILSFSLIPYPISNYINGNLSITDNEFILTIIDMTCQPKEYRISYHKGELENILENIIFYFCEIIKE